MNTKIVSMFAEYARAAGVAILTLIASGNFDPESIAIGAAASLLPLLARGANPNDAAFGRTKDTDV